MPTFTSVEALEKYLQNKMSKASDVALEAGKAAFFEAAGSYYTGSPLRYMRTGNLGSSPNATSITKGADTYSFTIFFDASTGYNTGKWDTPTVFDAANNGALVGSGGWVERGYEGAKSSITSVFRSFF